MTEQDDLLIEAKLIPDPEESEEMSAGDVEQLTDEEIYGSRLLLVRRAVEAIDLDGESGGAIQISCEFHPAENTRFSWAQVSLLLESPAGAKFISVQPDVVSDATPINFQVNRSGKLTLGYPDYAGVEAGGEKQKQYAIYHNLVRGSGEGTAKAIWTFTENPHTKTGLGQKNTLAITVPLTGTVKASLTVNCRIVRAGVKGFMDKVRDLIIERPEPESQRVIFEIPAAKSKSFFDFFKLTG